MGGSSGGHVDIDLGAKKKAAKKALEACSKQAFWKGWLRTFGGWFGAKWFQCAKDAKKLEWEQDFEMLRTTANLGEKEAYDLIEKLPSFVDMTPYNERVALLDKFEKARSVILNMDPLDKIFVDQLEKMV